MFYPRLSRRKIEYYYSNRNKFYADYRSNYEKISEDCQQRCVYCDISVTEHGGDEMHLDHFRPQEHFEKLSTHPYNLHLSCPKCNGLKTSDWPCSKEDGALTFIGKIGYIDRFERHIDEFLKVEDTGHITALAGPVEYMIKKMHLNRSSRVNIRRKRLIEHRKTRTLEGILRLTQSLTTAEVEGRLTKEQSLERRKQIDALLLSYSQL
ncbi:HNH endonuclease [Pseudomonas sp. NFACC32-1]|uniref:HNH endonuclease n=1 Tax=Pseudomonas sp. NFACC32-1 TaxID=1566198 RepID=UPI000876CF59|nr:HNH endonuclease [Pseudomonas sp. NFACC32-1]SCX69544.1 HNH endonuclease [Pseudomonas sp. NFACC32-1]